MTFFYYSLLILFRKPKPVDWIQKHQSPTLKFYNILILQYLLILAYSIGIAKMVLRSCFCRRQLLYAISDGAKHLNLAGCKRLSITLEHRRIGVNHLPESVIERILCNFRNRSIPYKIATLLQIPGMAFCCIAYLLGKLIRNMFP